MNRGLARRTVFEGSRDVRYFLSRLAWAVRARWIEVHAFCVMTTHFHLLVRSTEGELSFAMMRVQNDYVRWFNRGRRRDGALFRGRFRSRPVESLEYQRRLIRYIDDNPVLARLVPAPELYPHGSACHYARPDGPIWLERSWIEGEVRMRTDCEVFEPRLYRDAFGPATTPGLARVLDRRIECGSRSPDPLDDLLGAAPSRVLDWMRRKAALADGTEIALPVCDAEDVLHVIAVHRHQRGQFGIVVSRQRSCAWRLLEVALRRDLCAQTWPEIGASLGITECAAARAHRLHRRVLFEAESYAQAASQLTAEAVARCHGPRLGPARGPHTVSSLEGRAG